MDEPVSYFGPSDFVFVSDFAHRISDFQRLVSKTRFSEVVMQGETTELFGAVWGAWQQRTGEQALPVVSWRGDSDLLSHTRNGVPLPVGKLRTYQYREIQGGGAVLARLAGGQPLLTRSTNEGGPVYFCATLPPADFSSLAQDGVVFYVMIHRALAVGASTQSTARQLTTGTPAAHSLADWNSLSQPRDSAFLSMRPFQAGAFQRGDELIALNRPQVEDRASTLNDASLERLFSGLDYRLVEDRVGDSTALASEIWRVFLMAMAVALLAEAWLCLPERKRPAVEAIA